MTQSLSYHGFSPGDRVRDRDSGQEGTVKSVPRRDLSGRKKDTVPVIFAESPGDRAQWLSPERLELLEAAETERCVQTAIVALTLDVRLQSRCRLDPKTIDRYVEILQEGGDLDPIQAIRDAKSALWVWDGFHRTEAYRRAARDTIPLIWQAGTFEDAFRLSLGANSSHGLPRTRADLRRAIERALNNPQYREWSNRKIAELCGTTHKTVESVRKRLQEPPALPPAAPDFAPEQMAIAGNGDPVRILAIDPASSTATVTGWRGKWEEPVALGTLKTAPNYIEFKPRLSLDEQQVEQLQQSGQFGCIEDALYFCLEKFALAGGDESA